MEIRPFGSEALLIEYPRAIDQATHHQVMSLVQSLKNLDTHSIRFITPAYHSVTVGFDPELITHQALANLIKALPNQHSQEPEPLLNLDIKEVPVCYDPSLTPDLKSLEERLKLPWHRIISLHTSQLYSTYMLGFLPGFPYMGTTAPAIHIARKQNPSIHIPACSIAIAGSQTGIYPIDSPGGWWILGKTPIKPFDPLRADPCYFTPGDRVRFIPISLTEYQSNHWK